MIRNAWFKKVVASALLMSAVAAPVVTNADAVERPKLPSDVPAKVAALPAVKETGITSAVTDPLELAKKYAPDTVEDWKQTLEHLKKAAGEGTNSFSVIKAVPSIPATKMDSKELAKDVVSSEVLKDSLPGTPAVDLSGGPIRIQILDKLEVGAQMLNQAVAGEASTQSIVIDKVASESAIAMVTAHIALYEAVESKNEAAIKEALAKLLVQYKAEVKELEGAANS